MDFTNEFIFTNYKYKYVYITSKINAHERDSHVSFDEGPHVYTVDGDDSFTSVTTWNHSILLILMQIKS